MRITACTVRHPQPLLGAVLAAAPLLAGAQQATTPAPGERAIEEIVVTANRREERLQDVGLSVTALGSASLENLNITTATDITRAVPSLKMNAYSSSQVVFNIRGVAQNSYGDEQEPPVAVYQDDSYSSSINLASFPVFDLERVEAVRGPQGTLFGRNATGGAIQFISHKPTDEFEGYARADVRALQPADHRGRGVRPVYRQRAGTTCFISNKDDGYIVRRSRREDRGGNDHYALRGQIAWQPSEATDVDLILRYMQRGQGAQAGLYSQEPACPNAQRQGEFTPPTDGLRVLGHGPEGAAGTGFRNDAIMPSRGGDPWATEETSPSYVDRGSSARTLRVDAHRRAGRSSRSRTTRPPTSFTSRAATPHRSKAWSFTRAATSSRISQELRLSGDMGAHQLVGGLYFMKVDGDYTGQFADPFYGYLFTGCVPDCAYIPVITASQETTSFAVFCRTSGKSTDKLEPHHGPAILARRARRRVLRRPSRATTCISRSISTRLSGTAFGAPFDESVVPVTLTPDDATPTFDDVTARLELDYRVNDDLMVFASYNRGSKSGGFSFSTGTPFADFPPVTPLGTDAQFLNGIPFDPEALNAFEVGFKSTIGGTTRFERQRLLLRLQGLPGLRAARAQSRQSSICLRPPRPRGGDQFQSRGRPDAAARCLGR